MLIYFGLAIFIDLSDSAYNTELILKLSVQVGCCLILISSGTFITLSQSMIVYYLFTGFWLVAVMNSINMLDNMDGIITSVIINRLRRGQSPFVGVKDHTTHHLSYHVLSDRKVAMVMVGLSTI